MSISGGWGASSFVAAEDRQQVAQPGIHPPEVPNVTPVDGIGVMSEVVVGELLQPFHLGVNGGGTGEVGVEGGWLGVHRGLRDVIDDTSMNALFDQKAKLFSGFSAHIDVTHYVAATRMMVSINKEKPS